MPIGGDFGPLDPTPDDRLQGGIQQRVLSHKAKGSRVPHGGKHDGHALLRRRKTHSTELLTH